MEKVYNFIGANPELAFIGIVAVVAIYLFTICFAFISLKKTGAQCNSNQEAKSKVEEKLKEREKECAEIAEQIETAIGERDALKQKFEEAVESKNFLEDQAQSMMTEVNQLSQTNQDQRLKIEVLAADLQKETDGSKEKISDLQEQLLKAQFELGVLRKAMEFAANIRKVANMEAVYEIIEKLPFMAPQECGDTVFGAFQLWIEEIQSRERRKVLGEINHHIGDQNSQESEDDLEEMETLLSDDSLEDMPEETESEETTGGTQTQINKNITTLIGDDKGVAQSSHASQV